MILMILQIFLILNLTMRKVKILGKKMKSLKLLLKRLICSLKIHKKLNNEWNSIKESRTKFKRNGLIPEKKCMVNLKIKTWCHSSLTKMIQEPKQYLMESCQILYKGSSKNMRKRLLHQEFLQNLTQILKESRKGEIIIQETYLKTVTFLIIGIHQDHQ